MTLIELLICFAIVAIVIMMAVTAFSNKYKTGQTVLLNGNGDKGTIMSRLIDDAGYITYSILVKEPKTYTIILSAKDFSLYESVERE